MFCPQCKALLLPQKEGKKVILSCTCGYSLGAKQEIHLSEQVRLKKQDEIEVIEKKVETLPKTKDEECPKCKHKDAYYWLLQTRSSDEAATRFFRCVKCSHTWRQY